MTVRRGAQALPDDLAPRVERYMALSYCMLGLFAFVVILL